MRIFGLPATIGAAGGIVGPLGPVGAIGATGATPAVPCVLLLLFKGTLTVIVSPVLGSVVLTLMNALGFPSFIPAVLLSTEPFVAASASIFRRNFSAAVASLRIARSSALYIAGVPVSVLAAA